MTLSITQLLAERNADQLKRFEPFRKQADFIEAHRSVPMAYLSAGNGCGKTSVGAVIDVCHATGEYPDWWTGYRFEGPGDYWIFSTSPKTLIKGIQEQLFCRGGYSQIADQFSYRDQPWKIEDNRGGKLSKRHIHSIQKAPNVPSGNDYVEYVNVHHISGGMSTIWFGHYNLGPKKIAAKHNVLMIHFDEIPPFDMYSEAIARQRTTPTGIKGIITATPERSADQRMIDHVFDDEWEKNGNARTIITIDDVPDSIISAENKEQAKKLTPERDKAAKLYGQPVSGSMFFEVKPESFNISLSQWLRIREKNTFTVIYGMDFGFNDHCALAALYTDTQEGTVYLERSIKKQFMAAQEFYFAAKAAKFDFEIPVAWPHDGMRRDMDKGNTKEGRQAKRIQAQFYRDAGFNMIGSHTKRFLLEENKHAVFAEIESAAKSGMFYVVAGNESFNDEWRGLQLGEDGKVKGQDHIIDACTCAWLNRQFGKRPDTERQKNVVSLGQFKQAQNLGVSAHLLR